MLDLHYNQHHAAYVSAANLTLARLAEARAADDYEHVVGLEKSLAFNVSGHVLHTLFWNNLNADASERPTGELDAAITDAFGSFVRCCGHLTHATSTVQGSGWGALVWEPVGRRLLVIQLANHEDNIPGAIPLLVLDAWEHAYYLQYRNEKADYVDALFRIIDWEAVERRFATARSAQLITA
jgi:Fe-Mn family superoxide dismutase